MMMLRKIRKEYILYANKAMNRRSWQNTLFGPSPHGGMDISYVGPSKRPGCFCSFRPGLWPLSKHAAHLFFFLHCILGSTVWNDTHADQQIIRKSSNSAEMKSPQPKKQAHLISSSAIFFSINTESRNKSSNYK